MVEPVFEPSPNARFVCYQCGELCASDKKSQETVETDTGTVWSLCLDCVEENANG